MPTIVAGFPSTDRVVPTTAGFPPSFSRQSRSLITTTEVLPPCQVSSSRSRRPAWADTPSTEKKLPVTAAVAASCGTPSIISVTEPGKSA